MIKGLFIRRFSGYWFGAVGDMLASLLSVVILTRLFDTATFGAINLLTITAYLFSVIAGAGLPQVTVRFFYSSIGKKTTRFLLTLLELQFVFSSAITLLIIGPGMSLASLTESLVREHLLLLIPLVYLMPVNDVLLAVHRAEGNAWRFGLIMAVRRMLGIFIGSLFVLFIANEPKSYMVGLIVGEVISFFILVSMIRSLIRFDQITLLRFRDQFNLTIFGIPLSLVGIASMLLSIGDRYIIDILKGDTEVGYYVVAYSAGSVVANLIARPFNLLAYPTYTSTWERDGENATRMLLSRLSNFYLVIAIPVFILGFRISPIVIHIFAGDAYSGVANIAPFVLAGILISGLTNLTVAGFHLNNRTGQIFGITIISLIINVVGNLILIPILGIFGAAIMTLVTYAFHFVITLILGFRYLSFSLAERSLLRVLVLACLAAFSIIYLTRASDDYLSMILSGLFASISYIVIIIVCWPDFRQWLVSLIKDVSG